MWPALLWMLGSASCNAQACDEQPLNMTTLGDCQFSRACGKLSRSGQCDGVREVVLRDKGLTELDSEVFSGMEALEKLDLSCNRLSALPDDFLEGLPRLSALHLHKNLLSTLPSNLLSYDSLQKLSIAGNPITFLPTDLYQGLITLQLR